MIGYKIADKITKVSRTPPQNSSETVTNEAEKSVLDIGIPKERYISPERDKILLMTSDTYKNNEISKNKLVRHFNLGR